MNICIDLFGEENDLVVKQMSNIGYVYLSLNEPLKATEFLHKALDISLKIYDEEDFL